MCGIYGYFNFQDAVEDRDGMSCMASLLQHRGPDGYGYFSDERCGLGNVRLSIIDPEGGEQPFYSEDKSIVVVQNGEIFNYRELRNELASEGVKFTSECDTEIILRMYQRLGIDCLRKFNGMFAIAIFDRQKEKLFLARDRIGEKPLYISHNESRLVFASEIKAFPEQVRSKPCLSSINAFLRLNYVPAPYTAFEDIYHVMPGTFLEINQAEGVVVTRWWDLASNEVDFTRTEDDFISEFNSILDDATKLRLVSDVPFGAFLSGGVDSSSVVGLMAKHMAEPVKTYSIGFPDPRFDESVYADMAARLFQTDHHLEVVNYDIIDEWEAFIYHTDQPHGDVSFMPMRKVASLAAKDVKMVLTGDGADELFAGYEKHVPFLSRDGLEGLNGKEFCEGYMPSLSLLDTAKCESLWKPEYLAEVDLQLVDRELEAELERVSHFDPINRGLFLDMHFLLPGNNLVKPDRMAMAESLETRAPFLDYRMMEFAFTMPGRFKLYQGDKKHLYKKAVTPLIGKDLAYRKKQMFTVPIGEWFRTQLNEFCRTTLLSNNSRILEYFKMDIIEEIISMHLSGQANHTREVRALISLEFWLRRFL